MTFNPLHVNFFIFDYLNQSNITFSLTVREGTPTSYDAFVCYNPEGPDLEFVMEMINKLEGEYRMKLFVPERDDLPGMANSTTEAKLIEHRYTVNFLNIQTPKKLL